MVLSFIGSILLSILNAVLEIGTFGTVFEFAVTELFSDIGRETFSHA